MAVSTPIRCHDDVETALPDEKAMVDETVARMRHLMEESFEQHRHATSGIHAKTHGVVTGELQVLDGLPAELAQGLFGAPRCRGWTAAHARSARRVLHADALPVGPPRPRVQPR